MNNNKKKVSKVLVEGSQVASVFKGVIQQAEAHQEKVQNIIVELSAEKAVLDEMLLELETELAQTGALIQNIKNIVE